MKKPPHKLMPLLTDQRGQHAQTEERAASDFSKAHWRAFFQDMLSLARYEPADLLPFEEVREKLHLGSKFYLGVQEIPLEQIVGSVSRYEDFTRTFMPRKTDTRRRWISLEMLADSRGWPPVELYKVSDTYFVRDGNHRVSVARQWQMDTIEAQVWEYPTRVPLEWDDDLDDLILRAEYLEFLDDTRLDELRPEQSIILTLPGGYWDLEEYIAVYRHWLSLDQRRDILWTEAVSSWYDTVYVSLAEKIQAENILSVFPGRTEADLVVWILEHQEKLARRYGGEDILTSEAANDFLERARSNLLRRFWAWVERTFMGKPAG